ncbi:hypothetical protein BH09MYX1_BH09MYX1_44090 [soil metagenome]
MHRQIKVVAILLIVQGALELIMGGFFCIMGPVMMSVMSAAPPPSSGGAPPPPPEVFAGIYIAMGLPTAIAGILRIVSGIYNVRLRARTLGYVALGAGLLSMASCYCAPTSIALGVYGLIVFLNAKSGEAFAMVESGMTPDEALARIDGLVPMGPGGGPGFPPAPPPPPYPGY